MLLVVEIAADERDTLAPLFRENRYDTVVMNSVLEGYFGVAYSDSRDAPSVARLDSGAFTILGGNPKADAVTALIRHAPSPMLRLRTANGGKYWKLNSETGFHLCLSLSSRRNPLM
jgi:hypothetical protein